MYHADVIDLARKAGFETHDIIIVDFGPGIRDVFINQAITQRIIPKRHEYGLVFRKPTGEKNGNSSIDSRPEIGKPRTPRAGLCTGTDSPVLHTKPRFRFQR